jgi:hypothetical protein
VSDVGPVAALSTVLKPSNFGGPEPPSADGAAFNAVISSIGHLSVQTGAQLDAEPTASLGRTDDEYGNIVPLPYLNALSFADPKGPRISSRVGLTNFGAAPRIGLRVETPPGAKMLNGAWNANSEDILNASLRQPNLLGRDLDSYIVAARAEISTEALPHATEPRIMQAPIGAEVLGSITPVTAANASGTATPVAVEAPFALHDARFAEGLSKAVMMAARDGVQLARISINPPELGPVELRIVLRNDEATVQFASQHGAVRDALDAALPRLREQFEQAGLRLTDSGVFSELPSQSAEQQYPEHRFAAEAAGSELDRGDLEAISLRRIQHGFIDAYV